eukprot:TRINITY_DN17766_c0_g1_i1.p1 TRINITY_DN17766_c0_g1~~TRINITY_DN17766_c0_g1_i1.p1  ORF type:complete len:225 (-),score=46.22 TRINITY_DN17766_c0_g1_i1:97-771(-)
MDGRGRNLQRRHNTAGSGAANGPNSRHRTPTVEHNAALPYPVLVDTKPAKVRPKPPPGAQSNNASAVQQQRGEVRHQSQVKSVNQSGNPPIPTSGNHNPYAHNHQSRRLMKKITVKAESRSSSLPPWSRNGGAVNGPAAFADGSTVATADNVPRRGAISPGPLSAAVGHNQPPQTSPSPLPWCRNGGSPSRGRYAAPPPWCRVRSPSPTPWAPQPPPWCRVNSP